MKILNTFLLFITIILFANNNLIAKKKNSDKSEINHSLSVNLLLGWPAYKFAENYNAEIVGGFDFDYTFTPVNFFNQLEIGGKFGYIYAGRSTDYWTDVYIDTDNSFMHFAFLTRLRFAKGSDFEPFFEFSAGRNLSITETTYEIGDDFFFDDDDDDDEVTVKSFYDWSNYFSLGAGVKINKFMMLKFTYNLSPVARYINEDDVIVNGDYIEYESSISKVQILNISLGVNFSFYTSDFNDVKQYFE